MSDATYDTSLEFDRWRESARKSADAALDIYERESVEYEIALHLSRALRELERRV